VKAGILLFKLSSVQVEFDQMIEVLFGRVGRVIGLGTNIDKPDDCGPGCVRQKCEVVFFLCNRETSPERKETNKEKERGFGHVCVQARLIYRFIPGNAKR
jgi:hypothetical protein